MATSLTNLLYHIVFSTKGRVPLLHENLGEPVYEYLGGILRGQRSVLVEIGGMPDHVHLLEKLRADLAVASAIRVLKSNSSGWINDNRKIEGRFEWQVGIFCRVGERIAGCGGPPVHPAAGRAPCPDLVPGRVGGLGQEASDRVGRAILSGMTGTVMVADGARSASSAVNPPVDGRS
jgi:REP element-mobilizing transposase RayT